MEIYDEIMEELKSRNAYGYQTYTPFYICSFATHAFNLMNWKREVYWEAKRIPNMRLHVLMVAPSGYMKTFYLNTMGADKFAIFKKTKIDVGYEQAMTEAGFIGTVVNVNGLGVNTKGAAEAFKDGLLLIDEFSAVTSALKAQYNTQLDTQLLAALDHGRVYKRLSTGKIEYTTNLTLWAGVQPARYDLTSGLGRRLCFLVFLPTRYDNDKLLELMHKTKNLRPDAAAMKRLWAKINLWIGKLDKIQKVSYADDVLKKYRDMRIFSYESSYFDRLILGYHLAKYGPDKEMVLHLKDKELVHLVELEKKWRDIIGKGIDYMQVSKIIDTMGGAIDRSTLVEEAVMVGWNAQQIYEMTGEMIKYGMLKIKGNIIELIK